MLFASNINKNSVKSFLHFKLVELMSFFDLMIWTLKQLISCRTGLDKLRFWMVSYLYTFISVLIRVLSVVVVPFASSINQDAKTPTAI